MSRIKVFNSHSKDYHQAFQVFLNHTDQKQKAKEWLETFIRKLHHKHVFLDAGAGNGKVTAWIAEKFDRVIALEPNASLCKELHASCPKAEIQQAPILDATLHGSADFILASHVFYYMPQEEWLANLERLVSWLSPRGAVVVMLQNPDTDCMNMLRHFSGKNFDLLDLAKDFKAKHTSRYKITMDTVQSHVLTSDFKSAYTIAEFILNLIPFHDPPTRTALEGYVQEYFAKGGAKYRFSCHQDFLQIRL